MTLLRLTSILMTYRWSRSQSGVRLEAIFEVIRKRRNANCFRFVSFSFHLFKKIITSNKTLTKQNNVWTFTRELNNWSRIGQIGNVFFYSGIESISLLSSSSSSSISSTFYEQLFSYEKCYLKLFFAYNSSLYVYDVKLLAKKLDRNSRNKFVSFP